MDPLTQHLEAMLGPGATFRDGQREAIEAVVEDGHRALVVERTGWGKSLVYWIATRVRRDQGHGPTLIISPLLALMRNQIAMAGRLGLRAATINSGNPDEWDTVQAGLADNSIDVLLISPERLANERFTRDVLPGIQGSIGLFVVDEAHCISDWGHDFRPDYRRIGRILRLLDPHVPVLATTATANDRVVNDVAEQLGTGAAILRGPLARFSLQLDAIVLENQAERLAWLAEQLPLMPGSGIVYCLTVADTQRVATFLQSQGIDARAYNAALSTDERVVLEDALLANEMKALVATVALGMGFDKPDLGFVVHYQRPGSAIAYYQQVGRAGRAVDHAYGVLLSGREDDEIAEFFMDSAFPPTANMNEILDALDRVESMTIGGLEKTVNLKRGRITQALKLLELDGAVAHDGGRYRRTPNPWVQDEERIARVIAARRVELAQMQAYLQHDGCLMEFLVRVLDDPDPVPCGRCVNCTGHGLPRSVDHGLVRAAASFLKRDLRPVKPRLIWAPDAVDGLSGRITPSNQGGMALCVYGDAGWGREVQRGKYVDGEFSRDLVEASSRAIRDRWHPSPAPTWVTALPSTAKPGLVDAFARSLADRLALPYVEALNVLERAEPQKAMENSSQQLRNAYLKLGIDGSAVRPGPVLLVDDIVDSGWTLTVAGWLLPTHGSGEVYPFALAAASARDS
ncbi:MAG: ATP-dependent helicase RecQ [Chloroflexota bacterium]|nr:ATP-dependent helicase RecQ [Chloroflexota bacterium]